MAGAPGQDAARITQQPPPVLLIPHVRVYVRHEGDSESSPLPAGKLWKPVLRDMYDVVRAFQPNLTAIEITMDCNAGSMGLKEVQERLESARNEVAKLEQAQDRMQAEGHGVLCQCAYCYGRSPVETKFADGRPA